MLRNSTLNFYHPLDKSTQPNEWSGYQLIVPICAVGNIGQLTCDLIISTLLSKQECNLVGRIYSPALMSVVGPNAFGPKGQPTTSTEVYESKQHKLVILQQRTSYYREHKKAYLDELVSWIKESNFENVIVLTSSFAQCNPDTSQLGQFTTPIQSITTKAFKHNDIWQKLEIKKIPDQATIEVVRDGLTFLPGSGLTKPLINSLEQASISALFLITFCSEGINLSECYNLANSINKCLDLVATTKCTSACDDVWVQPYSWDFQ